MKIYIFKITFFSIFLHLICFQSFSQSKEIVSAINSGEHDSIITRLYIVYGDTLTKNKQLEQGYRSYLEAYKYSEGIHKPLNTLQQVMDRIAFNFHIHSTRDSFVILYDEFVLKHPDVELNFPKAVYFLAKLELGHTSYKDSALTFSEDLFARGDSTGGLNLLNHIASYERKNGDFEKALSILNKIIDYYAKSGNEVQLGRMYLNIGNLFLEMGELNSCFESYNKAYTILKEQNDPYAMAYINNSFGNYHIESKNFKKARHHYSKAVEYCLKTDNQQFLGLLYNNIGVVDEREYKYQSALENYFNSLKIKRIYSSITDIISAYKNIGNLYRKSKDYKKALIYTDSALTIAKSINSFRYISSCYRDLAEQYYEQRKYNEAYDNLKYYLQYSDSLKNEETQKNIEKLQAEFSSKEREREIKLLKQENELSDLRLAKKENEIQQQNYLVYSIIGFVVLVLIILFVLYYNYRLKIKSNNELEEKNYIIKKQHNKIVESINYAKYIQNAFLVNEQKLEEKFSNLFLYFKPKDIVSGDFYYVDEHGDYTYYIVADCTGHGVPGGFMSTIGTMLLKNIFSTNNFPKPSEILIELHEGIVSVLNQYSMSALSLDGMDISIVRHKKNSNELCFSGAMLPMFLVFNDSFEMYEGNLRGVGGYMIKPSKNEEYRDTIVELKSGTSVYLCSDGYLDQFGGPDGKKFNLIRFKELLIEVSSLPIEQRKSIVANRMKDWMGDRNQLDDLCLLGIQF